ncbi:glycosyltransferase [Sphingomonas sp. I4]
MSEVATEIAAADVVAIPSRWEGFGLVALEAMCGSCAVVASSVGGLREIIVDGVTGYLVPPTVPSG